VVKTKDSFDYSPFEKVNGDHPLKKAVPNAFIEYGARKRHGGRVAFFNFALAREMGLLPSNHPDSLTVDLEKKILETFSLVIINEYDLMNNVHFPKEDILPNKYMATRYLQLQHPNKNGKTSGDGRSIWNGFLTHEGVTWDISSCGTGATCLSPATNIHKKFYQTGDPTVSYGCGYSEIDEGLSSLFFSEVLWRNNIETERVLGIIEFAKGISINIRAHRNLLRPSHFFRFLKLSDREGLKQITDYYIHRQKQNGDWKNIPSKKEYEFFLERVTESFAKTVAQFENEYIFCWLDWDGDNILMDGGIIDYGSVRQFGLFHHEYRYDDVERFSTTILEQKNKARCIIQSFAQATDYLQTGIKRKMNDFKTHPILKQFDEHFTYYKNKGLLYKIGFNLSEQEYLLKNCGKDIEEYKKSFTYFERAKSSQGKIEVPDGITCNAIYCMRDILRELPQLYLAKNRPLNVGEFIQVIRSSYATKNDLTLSSSRDRKIALFQFEYFYLLEKVSKFFKKSSRDIILNVMTRSSIINKYDRITGDSIINITRKVMKFRPKLKCDELYDLMRQFAGFQNFCPEKEKIITIKNSRQKKYIGGMLKIVREHREGL